MTGLVLAVAMLLVAAGALVLLRPAALRAAVEFLCGSFRLYALALLVLLMGASLIAAAPVLAGVPWLAGLGWLQVLAALLLVVLPLPVSRRLGLLLSDLPPLVLRLGAALTVALGGRLAWAVLA